MRAFVALVCISQGGREEMSSEVLGPNPTSEPPRKMGNKQSREHCRQRGCWGSGEQGQRCHLGTPEGAALLVLTWWKNRRVQMLVDGFKPVVHCLSCRHQPAPGIQLAWHLQGSPGDFNTVVEIEGTARGLTASACAAESGQRLQMPTAPVWGQSLTD